MWGRKLRVLCFSQPRHACHFCSLRRGKSTGHAPSLRLVSRAHKGSSFGRGYHLSFARTWSAPYFSSKYLVFEKEIFDDLLSLAKSPAYLKEMRLNALSFKIGRKDYLVLSRTHNVHSEEIRRFADYCKRTLQNERRAMVGDPIILWEQYSNEYHQITLASEVWRRSFDVGILPYGAKERARIVHVNS